MKVYYAQNREDLLIKSFFPEITDGFYFDVGANDPVLDSVTKLFYDEGWSGINIEPIRRLYKALRADRPRDVTLNIGIGSKPGKLEFTEYPDGDGLSTFDTDMKRYYEGGNHPFPTQKHKTYSVPVKTIAEVIAEHGVERIHFMKIDVEGFEYDVIKGYDWKTVRPELLCIEANHIPADRDWRPILKNHHYQLVFFDGLNNYYLAKEAEHRLKSFNYPQAVFSGDPVSNRAHAVFEQQVNSLKRMISDRDQEIYTLQGQQRNVRFLAKRLAIELKTRLSDRAHQSRQKKRHIYVSDQAIAAVSRNAHASRKELLAAVHERDQDNVKLKKPAASGWATTIFWKLAYAALVLALKVAKKARRR